MGGQKFRAFFPSPAAVEFFALPPLEERNGPPNARHASFPQIEKPPTLVESQRHPTVERCNLVLTVSVLSNTTGLYVVGGRRKGCSTFKNELRNRPPHWLDYRPHLLATLLIGRAPEGRKCVVKKLFQALSRKRCQDEATKVQKLIRRHSIQTCRASRTRH